MANKMFKDNEELNGQTQTDSTMTDQMNKLFVDTDLKDSKFDQPKTPKSGMYKPTVAMFAGYAPGTMNKFSTGGYGQASTANMKAMIDLWKKHDGLGFYTLELNNIRFGQMPLSVVIIVIKDYYQNKPHMGFIPVVSSTGNTNGYNGLNPSNVVDKWDDNEIKLTILDALKGDIQFHNSDVGLIKELNNMDIKNCFLYPAEIIDKELRPTGNDEADAVAVKSLLSNGYDAARYGFYSVMGKREDIQTAELLMDTMAPRTFKTTLNLLPPEEKRPGFFGTYVLDVYAVTFDRTNPNTQAQAIEELAFSLSLDMSFRLIAPKNGVPGHMRPEILVKGFGGNRSPATLGNLLTGLVLLSNFDQFYWMELVEKDELLMHNFYKLRQMLFALNGQPVPEEVYDLTQMEPNEKYRFMKESVQGALAIAVETPAYVGGYAIVSELEKVAKTKKTTYLENAVRAVFSLGEDALVRESGVPSKVFDDVGALKWGLVSSNDTILYHPVDELTLGDWLNRADINTDLWMHIRSFLCGYFVTQQPSNYMHQGGQRQEDTRENIMSILGHPMKPTTTVKRLDVDMYILKKIWNMLNKLALRNARVPLYHATTLQINPLAFTTSSAWVDGFGANNAVPTIEHVGRTFR